jgi:hypothetical protein
MDKWEIFQILDLWFSNFTANTKKKNTAKLMMLGCSAENTPKGLLDVPVPQTVDKGVQHECDHDVHH